ncbi:MAG: IS200/IS605 family element transposase accessory protein TnpB [Candidatus Lokiarchaeota archaeon]|nr:IS200/IS605 family element transposase accessory protein TnpB [Candidatus Lokiarchaeota archaeon]
MTFFLLFVIYYIMPKAYKYRIYPNNSQKTALAQGFGNCRFVYNNALAFKKSQYDQNKKSISCFDLINRLTTLKSEFDFLKISPSQTLQQSLRNLDSSYKNFFKKTGSFPNFKSKFAKQTLNFPQGVKIDFKNSRVYIPKIGKTLGVLHRKFPTDSKIKTCTVSKTTSNKYFISILVETEQVLTKPKIKQTIGIDLGIKDFLTMSNGKKIANPKHYKKSLMLLKDLQRSLNRKIKSSNNYYRMKLRIAKLHEYISNCRKDFLHKESLRLIDENQAIFLEDLDVKGLQEKSNKIMNRNISDVSWGEFVRILEYKANWYGRDIVKIDPRNTSKMCSVCKKINAELALSDREWQCKHCHSKHDRDINAAKNIYRSGTDLWMDNQRLSRKEAPTF